MKIRRIILSVLLTLPATAFAQSAVQLPPPDLTHHWAGYASLVIIVAAYIFAMLEDVTMLRKSKSMILGATLVWLFILLAYRQYSDVEPAVAAFKSNLQAYI